MRISQQVRYALAATFDLAYNGYEGAVQVRVVSERQDIPMRYLEQIFRRLRKAGLVSAKRGPGGGYRLARPRRQISVAEVIEAVEGPILEAGEERALAPGAGKAQRYTPDFLAPLVGREIQRSLTEIDFEEICRDAARRGVRRWNAEAHIYQI